MLRITSNRSGYSSIATLVICSAYFCPTALPAVPSEDREKSTAIEAKSSDPLQMYIDTGISKDQETQIRRLARSLEETNVARAHQIMSLLKDIKNLSIQRDLDEKKLLADQKQINDLQADMSLDRIKCSAKIRHLMTPAQRSKLVLLMEDARKTSPMQ